MGLLQGLVALLRNSAKKLIEAIFGWSVDALFGHTRPSERTVLSTVVGAAAAWPFLLLGIPFPKVAAFVLLLVPIPSWVSSGVVRVVWIVVAIAIPVVVGIVLARRGREDTGRRSPARRLLQGLPVTVALGAAFFVALVTSPVRRVIALCRGWKDEHLPLLIESRNYRSIAARIRQILARGGLPLDRARAPWLLVGPSHILRAVGGEMFAARIPRRLPFFRSEDLEVAVHATGVTLQGEPAQAGRAHALLSEQATFLPALQTTDPAAQELEKQLKQVWAASGEDAKEGSPACAAEVEKISASLARTFLDYEQWQILYREVLQMSRAVAGKHQLLEHALKGGHRRRERRPARPSRSSRFVSQIRRGARRAVHTESGFANVSSNALQRLFRRIWKKP
jgi:hypothetical protein